MRIITYIIEFIREQLELHRQFKINKIESHKNCAACDGLIELLRLEKYERDRLINEIIAKHEINVQPSTEQQTFLDRNADAPITPFSPRSRAARFTHNKFKSVAKMQEEFEIEQHNQIINNEDEIVNIESTL